MTKQVKGTLHVGRTAKSQDKNVVTTVNNVEINATNGYEVDSYTKDEILAIISVLPVSNFVPNPGLVTTSGYVINFNSINPALLSGNYLELPVSTIDLRSIKSNPASTTFYVYIEMDQGLPMYTITDIAKAEGGSLAYNSFWIGTVTTDTTKIFSTNIIERSRLDVFGASTTAAGSSFPVSTGLPSQSGNINW